ncbi:hypothetical protein ABT288_45990 [Streptomyces sp. NPDC001093]|uniref:hypothetical protein n=1 Tax=Streptomyces sp. NPDC001093 TaxID=3154376 RepID=UPI0033209B3F
MGIVSGDRPGRVGGLRELRRHSKARGETAADLMGGCAIIVPRGSGVPRLQVGREDRRLDPALDSRLRSRGDRLAGPGGSRNTGSGSAP